MTVLTPASFAELRSMLRYAVEELDGPVALRYPRGGEGKYQDCCGREAVTQLRSGADCTIVSYGPLINEALAAAHLLEEKGVHAAVVKLNRIAPLSCEDLQPLWDAQRLVVLEDCVASGCVGQRLAALLLQAGKAPGQLLLKNVGDRFISQGSVAQLYKELGLDAAGVAQSVEEMLHER